VADQGLSDGMIGAVGHDTRHREQVCQSIRPEAGHAFTSQPPTHPSSGRSHHRHGRSQVVDRWQPRVGDQEEGRKEQPDHDGRDERSVEGVESAPVTRGNPWRDRWRRRHAGRSIRSGLTGGCPVPRGILAARSSHAPSPSHPCTTLPVPAAMRAPPSRAPICPARLARVPHHATIIPYPTRAVHPLGDARQRPPPSGAKTPTDAGPRSPDRLHDVTRRGQ